MTKNLETFLEDLYSKIDWSMIPSYMIDSLKDYIEFGVRPGSFLNLMLEKRIYDAVWHADRDNSMKISDWVKFMEWSLPSELWGSEEKVRDWENRGGYRGR
jgi:hypothetical protein